MFGSDFNHNPNVPNYFGENRKCKILQKSSLWHSLCFMQSERSTNVNMLVVAIFFLTRLYACPYRDSKPNNPPLFDCVVVGYAENCTWEVRILSLYSKGPAFKARLVKRCHQVCSDFPLFLKGNNETVPSVTSSQPFSIYIPINMH